MAYGPVPPSPDRGRAVARLKRLPERSGPVRCDDLAAGEQFAGVLEDHDTVAEQRPALLGVAGDGAGRLAIGCVCVRALRQVWAHGCPLVRRALVALSLQFGSVADVVEPVQTAPEVTIWYQTTT